MYTCPINLRKGNIMLDIQKLAELIHQTLSEMDWIETLDKLGIDTLNEGANCGSNFWWDKEWDGEWEGSEIATLLNFLNLECVYGLDYKVTIKAADADKGKHCGGYLGVIVEDSHYIYEEYSEH